MRSINGVSIFNSFFSGRNVGEVTPFVQAPTYASQRRNTIRALSRLNESQFLAQSEQRLVFSGAPKSIQSLILQNVAERKEPNKCDWEAFGYFDVNQRLYLGQSIDCAPFTVWNTNPPKS